MEFFGYLLLIIVAVCWLIAVLFGMIAAFPLGLIGIIAIIGFGVLFIRVLRDRLANREDDYYDKTVEK